MNENILSEYDKNIKKYNDFKNKLEVLLKELLVINEINYHHIATRVKTKDSLNKKIDKKDKYWEINEITDVVGCRIISYFDDDVDQIVEILKKEFDIDEDNSVNKKAKIESDKFGYLSYHIVCSLNSTRFNLNEYKRYKDIKFEIQIRTILQHAWAEIEHDIGYKSKQEIPKIIRRKFSRIAGLLETADESFCEIKQQLKEYNASLKENAIFLMNQELNLDSLYEFTIHNELVKELNIYLCDKANWQLRKEINKDDLSRTLNKLTFFNINSLKGLESSLIENKEKIKLFAKEWLKEDDYVGKEIEQDICYFYLSYVLSAKANNIANYIRFFNIGGDDEGQDELELSVKEVYETIANL